MPCEQTTAHTTTWRHSMKVTMMQLFFRLLLKPLVNMKSEIASRRNRDEAEKLSLVQRRWSWKLSHVKLNFTLSPLIPKPTSAAAVPYAKGRIHFYKVSSFPSGGGVLGKDSRGLIVSDYQTTPRSQIGYGWIWTLQMSMLQTYLWLYSHPMLGGYLLNKPLHFC